MTRSPKSAAAVLLVEDHVLVRKMVAYTLMDAGYEVTEAGSGVDALGLLQQGLRPFMLLSDVRMPGALNGLQLARQARKLMPHLPVLLMTGYNELATHEFRLLLKPFTPNELLACMVEVLGER